MKKFFYPFLVCVFAFSFLNSCNKTKTVNKVDPAVVEEISSENLERLSPIVIRFAKEIANETKDAFSLSPSQKGSWSFDDKKTSIFTPSNPYKANSKIKLSVNTKKLFNDDTLEKITYTFLVSNPSYSVNFEGLEINRKQGIFSLKGTLVTDIPVSLKDAKNVITANLTGKSLEKKLDVSWETTEKSSKHIFVISDSADEEKDSTLSVSWKGKSLGISAKEDEQFSGTRNFEIPSSNTFSIVNIDAQKENTIRISFSEELNKSQDFLSYINLINADEVVSKKITYSINGNIANLYCDDNWDGVTKVAILTGVQSESGKSLKEGDEFSFSTTWDMPTLKFSTDGNILPTSQGTTLSVQTKNLSGLAIVVYEIYNNNMLQFLQVNDLDGKYQLDRVSEPVWSKEVSLNWDDSMQNKFISHGIDLSELVKKYPKGMFNIEISFTKKDIRYVCPKPHNDFSAMEMPPSIVERVGTDYDMWTYLNKLTWKERNDFYDYKNDPCHPAFYLYDDYKLKRNILISDIGIIAKKTDSGKLYVTTTDLKNATAFKDVDVVAYSKVNQKLYSKKSDSNGSVVFDDTKDVSVIVASTQDQSSYLKLAEGTSLSISHFNTGGERVQKGTKGYIYGERGVWRPGDFLYLTFVVQDTEKVLPSEMPISFDLQDPLGRVIDTQTITKSINGFYPITTKTSEDAPTGLWLARVKLGGREWTKSLRIETVIPNHLDVKLTTKQKYLTSEENNFVLTGKWLHGAPTPNYKADIAMRLLPLTQSFDGYEKYTFVDHERTVDSKRQTMWEGSLDSSSKANISLYMNEINSENYLPGKVKAQFITRIFEPSGMFSTEQTSFDYSPYSRYVGLCLPEGDKNGILITDENHRADVVLLSQDGVLIKNATLSYTMYKLEWRWWWEQDALSDATYVSTKNKTPVASGKIDIKNGRGNFNIKVNYPEWGRYVVVVKDETSGHSAAQITYIDWPGWASRAQNSSDGAAIVPLTMDKTSYTVGENAIVSFSSAEKARALITIEKSGEILKQDWIETQSGTTTYKLNLTEKMAPNVYIHVTLLQQHMQTANSLPIRLYGVVPVIVDNPKTNLTPVITMPKSYEPNKKSTLTVSEKNGKKMTFTVAIVDEGLLGLTNFKAANLRDEFYKKEASLLSNWDVFKYVMNAYTGKLETLLSVGGSEEVVDSGSNQNNRFTPVVHYFGPFELEANRKKEITFDMPQYIGAVRAMVVAGDGNAYGTAENSVPVKSDLMVLPSLPRTIGTNETVNIPVTVFNGTDKNQNVSVTLDVSGSCKLSETKTVLLGANENKEAMFTVKTANAGDAKFSINAKSSSIKTSSETTVKVLSRGLPVSYKQTTAIEAGKTYTAKLQTPTDKTSAKLSVEVSPFPAIDLSSRLEYLISYPHGCAEQITSGAFPQLYIADFVQLSASEIEQTKSNIQSVFDRYPQYQTAEGGMAYWPGGNESSTWASCYVAHFLIEAKKAGYQIPTKVFDKLISWIAKSAKNWILTDYDRGDVQAYKLFVLAEAGKSDIGAMNRLRTSKINEVAKLMLAASYAKSGRSAVANELFDSVSDVTTLYRETGRSFASPLRDKAIMLYVSNMLNKTSISSRLAKQVAEKLSTSKWYSTQETAWSLCSVLPYYISQKGGNCSYEITNESGTKKGTVKKGAITEDIKATNSDEQTVTIKNTGDKVAYVVVNSYGLSKVGTETKVNNGLNMTVTYSDISGNRINPTSLKLGDTFKINVQVKNTLSQGVENIALTLPVPSAWEFSNDRIGADEKTVSSTSYTNQDIRDEAIYTYFDLQKDATFENTFYATVVYSGEYYIPAIQAQAMYDDEIKAIEPGIHIVQN